MFFKLSLNEYLENRNSLLLLSKKNIQKGEFDSAGLTHLTKKRVIEWIKTNKEKLVSDITEWNGSLKKEYVLKFIKELIESASRGIVKIRSI